MHSSELAFIAHTLFYFYFIHILFYFIHRYFSTKNHYTINLKVLCFVLFYYLNCNSISFMIVNVNEDLNERDWLCPREGEQRYLLLTCPFLSYMQNKPAVTPTSSFKCIFTEKTHQHRGYTWPFSEQNQSNDYSIMTIHLKVAHMHTVLVTVSK